MIKLIKTTARDLESIFEFQADTRAVQMAAFTSENPGDKSAYMSKWTKIIENPNIHMMSIFNDEELVGSILHFDMGDETNVSYGISPSHWGKGYASKGLSAFLQSTSKRPLYGRAAFDNIGSQKVMEKNGFKRVGKEVAFANARKAEIEEFVYLLD